MPLVNLCDDVFQSMLDYLEYEEIARLSQTNEEVFVMCDDYVQRDVGTSVADLYHFALGTDVTPVEKIEIGDDTPLWDAIAILV
jgi:hypothetical protein